jgi:hypothetical protein
VKVVPLDGYGKPAYAVISLGECKPEPLIFPASAQSQYWRGLTQYKWFPTDKK